MRIRSSKYFNAPELSNSKKTDLLSGDVYSLGVTLLCALYLCEPIDLQSHQRIGKSFFGKYDIFSILNSMIPPS